MDIISKLRAGGGTCMTCVFEDAQVILTKRKKVDKIDDLCILFLTDG